MTSPVSTYLARYRTEPALVALTITLAVLCLAWVVAPSLSNTTPLLACAFLLALLSRRAPSPVPAAGVKLSRIFWFLLLEIIVFSGIWLLRAAASLPDGLPAAARYAVLLPPLVLLPWRDWRRFLRTYRAECLAVVIASLTWFPHRLFMAAWPYYSQALGHAVYFLAHPFVSYLQYVPDATPTLLGPHLDITILFGCSGLQAIKLFQILFAFVLIVDWNVLNRRRIVQGYFAGLAIALLSNVVRIVLLVVLGNRVSTDVVLRLHAGAGWVFFAAVFSACLWLAYNWLRGSNKSVISSQEHGQFQIAPGPAK